MFGYCIVVSLTAFSVICNKTFYKVYTLLSHTPHHTKSPLGSRGRDTADIKFVVELFAVTLLNSFFSSPVIFVKHEIR